MFSENTLFIIRCGRHIRIVMSNYIQDRIDNKEYRSLYLESLLIGVYTQQINLSYVYRMKLSEDKLVALEKAIDYYKHNTLTAENTYNVLGRIQKSLVSVIDERCDSIILPDWLSDIGCLSDSLIGVIFLDPRAERLIDEAITIIMTT